MDIVSNWNNLNETRAYPLVDGEAQEIPCNVISDMQFFAVSPRFSGGVYGRQDTKLFSEDLSDHDWPELIRLDVTRHMITVVVKCHDCTLFCTKPLDDVVAYEPVEFVSESGTTTGWIAFGNFDKGHRFSFSGSARVDPRAVVLCPTSTIGGFSVEPVADPVSGNVRLVGGAGITATADPETNSIVLSLDENYDNRYSDPCFLQSVPTAANTIGSINGVEAKNGTVVFAFTGDSLSSDNEQLETIVQKVENMSIEGVDLSVNALRFPAGLDSSGKQLFYDLVGVKLSVDRTVKIAGYRLVYVPVDPEGFSTRDLEFSIKSGYHRPEYDVFTRRAFLPGLAELYRSIKGPLSSDESSSPYFKENWGSNIQSVKFGSDSLYGLPVSSTSLSGGWDDGVLGDPYDPDLKLESRVDSRRSFYFSHRFFNSGVAGLFDSAYVEIVYALGSEVKTRASKRDISFNVLVCPDGIVGYDAVKKYVESGECHNYEQKHYHSCRYMLEGL